MRIPVSLFVVVVGISLTATAGNWNFLQYGAANKFSDEDWTLMQQTMQDALNDAPDGDTHGWSNPETDAFGTVQPVSTYERDGVTCRKLEIFNQAKHTQGASSHFDLCKQADGSWKIASPQQPKNN